jgi:pimeloyl-ACP methyl ester carboxylesterase
VSLHHELSGPADADVLVLSSSIGTTTALWDAQLPALGERFRVLRYDHPGHGRSSVERDLTVEGMADAAIAGAHIVTLPDAAHLANVEAPTAFTQAVLDHVSVREEVGR